MQNPEFAGDPYSVIPPGTRISFPSGEVAEATEGEKQKLKENIEWAEKRKQEMKQGRTLAPTSEMPKLEP